jgi:hypothetical protein
MSEIATEISGQEVIDLCEKLGVDHKLVHRIEILPRSIMIVHSFRRGESGKGLIISDPGPNRDALQQVTDVAIRWSGLQ